ncbi:MAG TPA: DUF5302 domain-containing protein [Actinopolymorphaceae bacterium]|jgi:hypothetical protein
MSGQDLERRGRASKAASASATTEPAPDAGENSRDNGNASSEDDVRQRFRETLERKRRRQTERPSVGGGKSGSKVHDGFRPTLGRRSFRRKSGS